MANTGGVYHRVAEAVRPATTDQAATLADPVLPVLPLLSRGELREALTRLKPAEIDEALRHRVFPVTIAPGMITYAGAAGAAARNGRELVAAVPRDELLWALQHCYADRLQRNSIGMLQRAFPDMSAAKTFSGRQLAALAIALVAMAAIGFLSLEALKNILRLFFCIFFMLVVAIKGQAILALFAPRTRKVRPVSDGALPQISVLVPLFRETAVLEQLMRGLLHLRYPADRLDIKLVIEASDAPMRQACAMLRLPAHIEIVTVPAGGPQTKPKALNYALQLARGEIITVFDAEDVPDPDQLLKAAAAFAAAPPEVVCLQAALSFYNPSQNWLTRQFALEYACLFEFILPSLAENGLPLPLGGTSNHFRAEALRRIGAWDPHNVTEDADLGLRMARFGLRAETIDSRTHEEATSSLRSWLRQRARWQKGYMMTWLVHMRTPRQVRQDIGLASFLVIQAMMLGTALSAVLHPVFLAIFIWDIADGSVFPAAPSLYNILINGTAISVLVIGYGTGLVLGVLAALRSGSPRLLRAVPAMPLYWLLISFASWRALWELFTDPHHWHKTEHGAALSRKPKRPAR